MAEFRTVLPLLLLGLIEVTATNNQGLAYFDAPTSTAVTYFNEETNETNSSGVMATEPQPQGTTTSGKPDHLNFTAKETDGQMTENSTGAFKTKGAVRAKRGFSDLLKNVMKKIVNKAVEAGVKAVLKKNTVSASKNKH